LYSSDTCYWLVKIAIFGMQLGALLFEGIFSEYKATRVILIVCSISILCTAIYVKPERCFLLTLGIFIIYIVNTVLVHVGVKQNTLEN